MPLTTSPTRAAVRDLADHLVVEYAGALPAGQVLALVHRTAAGFARLATVSGLSAETWLDLCEVTVRRALTERLTAAQRLHRVA